MQIAMVAAGFTAGEADRLRRSMAAWRRKGGIEQYARPIIDGMVARGYEPEFAQAIFRQILGFGEYGFPESHAASFALLVYASAWLKCHEPAAFCAALLNSQPMGFYSPSQLVQDLRRHGVTVLPVDVDRSEWDCALERRDGQNPALRLGLRQISGFNAAAAGRIVAARRRRAFDDLHDLARRALLDRGELDLLAGAGALVRLGGHRHQAHWQAAAIEEPRPLFERAETAQLLHDAVELPAPGEAEDLVQDYRSIGLTLGRHPLALLRARAPFAGCCSAHQLHALNSGRFVRVAGLVTGRQRPGTASGVLFLTLEDETGNINVVVWRDRQERFRKALLRGKLLLVKGVMESRDSVVHVIAGEILDHSAALGALQTRSRDFH